MSLSVPASARGPVRAGWTASDLDLDDAGEHVEVLRRVPEDLPVGLDQERPYRLQRLRDPQRLVLDLETR